MTVSTQKRIAVSVGVSLSMLLVLMGSVIPAVCPVLAEAHAEEAAAEAWPMFRGVVAGTGRSAARISLPLAERWHRQLEKTAFEATPVVADGRIFVGDLDGTFHCLDLADGKTNWSFKTDVGFPAAAAVSTDADVPLVVVGDAAGMVRAFDVASGEIRWTHETGGEVSGGPPQASGYGSLEARGNARPR